VLFGHTRSATDHDRRRRPALPATGPNVYFVESNTSGVLVDTAWPRRGRVIARAAEELFGPGTCPAASALDLARTSRCTSTSTSCQ
jgi:hypothetical protein